MASHFYSNAPVPTTIAQAINSLAQVRNLPELINTLPYSYRASFSPLLEELYKGGQKAALSLGGLKSLKNHQDKGSLPAHLKNLRPVTLQVSKAFSTHSALLELQQDIKTKHAAYVADVLGAEIKARRGEYHVLVSQISPLTYSDRLMALCNAIDRDLVAHLYFNLPTLHARAADTSFEVSNPPAVPLPASVAPAPRVVEVGDDEMDVVPSVPEPTEIKDDVRKVLLGELDTAGERITAALAEHWCRKAITLGKGSADISLAQKLKKVTIRDEARKEAAKPSAATPAPGNNFAAKLESLEKTIRSLAANNGTKPQKGKLFSANENTKANTSYRGQKRFTQGEEPSQKRRAVQGSWEEARGGSKAETGEEGCSEKEGLNALRRCTYFVNGENIPDTVLKVPFASVVAYMKDHVIPEQCIEPTPVFRSPGVISIPEEIERI